MGAMEEEEEDGMPKARDCVALNIRRNYNRLNESFTQSIGSTLSSNKSFS